MFDLDEEKQIEAIKTALKEIKNWGVLRDSNGKVVAYNDFDINDFRKYTELYVDENPDWVDTIIEKYKTRLESRYQSKCTKIQINLDNYAETNDIDFNDIYNNGSNDNEWTTLLDQAYNDNLLTDNFIPPTTCTTEMKEICKVKKSGTCRPCTKDDIIEGTDSTEARVACPYLCSSDLAFPTGDPNSDEYKEASRKSKLCAYCKNCTGDSVNDPGTGTLRNPPVGKEWTVIQNLDKADNSPTTVVWPKKFSKVNNQDGLSSVSWWKYFYPEKQLDQTRHERTADRGSVDLNSPEFDSATAAASTAVSVRSCPGDTVRQLDSGGDGLQTREGTHTGGQHSTRNPYDTFRTFSSIDGISTKGTAISINEKGNENSSSMLDSATHWKPSINSNVNDTEPYIILDMGVIVSVSAVVTQTSKLGPNSGGSVSKYKVQISDNGVNWENVGSITGGDKFTHNTTQRTAPEYRGGVWDEKSQGTFRTNKLARYIKVMPVEKYNGKPYALRLGVVASSCSGDNCVASGADSSSPHEIVNPMESSIVTSGNRPGYVTDGKYTKFDSNIDNPSAWCAQNNNPGYCLSDSNKVTQDTCGTCSDVTKTSQSECRSPEIWSPGNWDPDDKYIILDLESKKKVLGLFVQGNGTGTEYIISMKIQYYGNLSVGETVSSITFKPVYSSSQQELHFSQPRSGGADTKVSINFQNIESSNNVYSQTLPLKARYIKVIPTSWKDWPCLRVGVKVMKE